MSTVSLRLSKESPSAQAGVWPLQWPQSADLLGRETGGGNGRAAASGTASQQEGAEAFSVDGTRLSQIAAESITAADVPKNQVMGEWHGMVTHVLEGTFVAELKGLIGKGVKGAVEEAIIPVDEVRQEDLPFLVPGAFFRLTVNNVLRPDGKTRRRFTDITFRRMPAYRREELEEAAERGQALARVIRVE